MKKLLALLLGLSILLLPVLGFADAPYTLSFMPDLYALEEPGEYFIDYCMPVKISWDTVFYDDTIHTHVFLPYNAQQLVTVALTDGYHLVCPDMREISEDFVYLVFDTNSIREFTNTGAWLLFICKNDPN